MEFNNIRALDFARKCKYIIRWIDGLMDLEKSNPST
jgi:hypothetical protein